MRRLQAGDVEEAARLHRASFPGFFLSSPGERFLREFYRGFLSDETAVTAVARDTSGRLQGVAVGTTQPSGFFSRLLRRRFLGFAPASALAVVRRPSELARLVRGVAYRGGGVGEGALLSSICVAPGDRGAGTGARLMVAWTSEAVRLGATAAHLTTDAVDNDLVRGFYARQGWRATEEFVSAEGRPMIVYAIALGGVARSQSADTSR
ncbi:GNAT family N-acetyltransferase [Nocardioides sp. B-3]|uniref:GNAT family N-acetyltransferase n=1 Tax=Nocardioides sp. B-3 TaxID=2895565 RepID=UPI002152D996|nr:GNAT family N-acetyltransferase [Nocardioides sp. B-3]UUZ61044.1 GNAT family N-acetyltransferase [Nocardioides sp. B-3]